MRKKDDIPVAVSEQSGLSSDHLLLCETPSCKFWVIGHYDSHYALAPWRAHTNQPVSGKVIAIRDLPPLEAFGD